MDIRTKLALALVTVSLVSMAILGTFAYQTSASLLKEISVRQLDALAETKKRDLIKVYEGWQDQVRLVRSRTQLRESLARYLNQDDDAALQQVRRIIEDAATAVNNVDRITVLNMAGEEVASFGNAVPVENYKVPANLGSVRYVGAYPGDGGNVDVVFTSMLGLEGERIGIIAMVIDAGDLFSVTGNYTGLGETGEAIVVMSRTDRAWMLNSPRHDDDTETGGEFLDNPSADVTAVLEQQERVFTAGVKDYRGVDVWSATRFIPGLNWGLVVKIDAAEEKQRATELRDALVDIAIALSAFAIIGGTLLGLYLAKPIHRLAEVVERFRRWETDVRANAEGDDEIAYLAESLNELMDQIQNESDNDKRPDA